MSKPLDYFPYNKNGQLTAEGIPLEKIADIVGTPAYVYSSDAFLSSLKSLQKGLAPLDHLICFAVKSNSNIAVLDLFAKAGAGMDLVSGGELYRAGYAGVPANRIVFSGVGKTPAEMRIALEFENEGIRSFNVESVAELEVLNAVALEAGRRAPVALRFNPDVDAKTHPYISTGLKKNKFGIQRKEVVEIIRNHKKYPGIAFRGISIHIGSQLLSLAPMKDAFTRLRSLVAELDTLLDEPLQWVDLGGGVGITYKNEKAPSIAQYCALIVKMFGPKSGLQNPLQIIIEPGRSLTGNAGVLLTEVLYRKPRKDKDFLVLDAAMNDLARPSLYGSYHEIVATTKKSGAKKKTDVVGPVCETGDCFAHDRALPVGLKQGDLVAILSAGAYGFTMSSNYNSRPRPPEVLVQGGKFRVIRERETYDNLIQGESL